MSEHQKHRFDNSPISSFMYALKSSYNDLTEGKDDKIAHNTIPTTDQLF
jgi:hypothetical protein